MTDFPSVVLDQWSSPFEDGEAIRDDDGFRLRVDENAEHAMRVQILTRPGRTSAIVSPEIAGLPGVREAADEQELRAALAGAGVAMNGADHLFFLPGSKKEELAAEADGPDVRRLTEADAVAFAAFEAEASEQDLDDAYVELDHWVVFGAFAGGELVAAGSAYPFDEGSRLADFGVLTLPAHRGRGRAREVVEAMARHVIGLGYEPQYRCQLDNAGSVALAHRTGFVELGTWDAPLPEGSGS